MMAGPSILPPSILETCRDDLDRVVERAGDALDSLRGGRLFLTGAGLTTVWLLATLAHANRRRGLGAEAVVLVADPFGFRRDHPDLAVDPAVEVLAGTPADFTYPQGPFTHIIHAVGEPGEGRAPDGRGFFDEAIDGTRRVLGFAADRGVPAMLLAGSSAVYDPIPAPASGDPPGAEATRALALRAAEHLCTLAGGDGLGVTLARRFPAIGPAMAPDDAGAPGPRLYAADQAAWLWVLLARGTAGTAYDVGAGVAGPAADRARGLGLEAWTPPDEAARRTAAWARAPRPAAAGTPQPEPPQPEPAAEKPVTFVIDVDGVVAALTPGNDYRLCRPIPEVVAAINRLFDRGHRIIMMTARGSATGIDWGETTRAQFARWGLRHHELRFGKPAADYYVDDRMVTVEMLCAMAQGRPFPPSTRAPRLTAEDGAQEGPLPAARPAV